jgi:hypothetical protein
MAVKEDGEEYDDDVEWEDAPAAGIYAYCLIPCFLEEFWVCMLEIIWKGYTKDT